jgi:hypothetical protein
MGSYDDYLAQLFLKLAEQLFCFLEISGKKTKHDFPWI